MNYNVGLSSFRVFPITERTSLRFNRDTFNTLNIHGYDNPIGIDDAEIFLSSYWSSRQLQFTIRLQP